jgi:hypothetical protein
LGSLERVIIDPEWVQSARKIELDQDAVIFAGLDLGEDVDRSVLCVRAGGLLIDYVVWEHVPMSQVCDEALLICAHHGAHQLAYDADGIGSEFAGHHARHSLTGVVKILPVRGGGRPTARRHEDSPTTPAKNRFENRVTELWWSLRMRFWKTHQRYTGASDWPDDECIQLPNDHTAIERLARQLSSVQWEHAAAGKIRRGKKRTGAESPDDADALVFCEMPHEIGLAKAEPRGTFRPVKKSAEIW